MKIKKILAFSGIILLVGSIVYGLFSAGGTVGSTITVGQKAPDFTLPSVEGGTFTLSEFTGKKNVLLYFQEGIMCPPCWEQEVDLEKSISEFQKMDVEIIMITVDPPSALARTKFQYGITQPLLYDNSLTASRQYGVLKDSMHPGERPGHVFVLVDKQGNVKWYYSAYKPSGDHHDHSGDSGTMYVSVPYVLANVKQALSQGVA